MQVPVFKWTKHGYVSIMVPGFDPPLDVAVCRDILNNPGPVIIVDSRKPQSEARQRNLDLHMNTTVTTSLLCRFIEYSSELCSCFGI